MVVGARVGVEVLAQGHNICRCLYTGAFTAADKYVIADAGGANADTNAVVV